MEIFDSFPKDYKRGKTKYIVVTGSVMSGVGKGTFNSGLANLLMFNGLNVSMLKFDGYLNVDAGTLNPYRHGEVFVLKDGTECDLDLGTYERALHRNLIKDNYLTSGKIFKIIIEKERQGKYLGRDVQFIPHVTGEIKHFIRTLAMKDKPDILIVEVGGTIGDLENSYFIEAMRELRYEEGKDNVLFVNLAYIIQTAQEQKSKAAQLGVNKLMSLGIMPDIVICRAKTPATDSIKEKISLVANISPNSVFSFPDLKSIYHAPLYFKEQKLDEKILNIFDLKPRKKQKFLNKYIKFINGINNPKKEINIGITGKYTTITDSYLSIKNALGHAGACLKASVKVHWIETSEIKNESEIKEKLKDIDGIIVPGGFGSRGTEGKISFIKYARENNIPFLGICYGMQLGVIEFARNICNLKDANSTEINPKTPHSVVSLLSEQKNIKEMGATMRLGEHPTIIKQSTLAYKIYKKTKIGERFRHRYEVNTNYIKQIEDNGLIFSGISADNKEIMQIMEYPKNKFHFGVQFHPELTSKPLMPSPVFVKFVENCL